MADENDTGILSRRFFIKGSAITAATFAVGCGPRGKRQEATSSDADAHSERKQKMDCPTPTPGEPMASSYDLTKSSGALEADEIIDTSCQFCNSNCRLKVHKKPVASSRFARDKDPVQAGNLCVKGPDDD